MNDLHGGMRRTLLAGVALAALSAASTAAEFASRVVSYDPGAAAGGGFVSAAAALGSPDAVTGEGAGFANVLSPFSPAFEADEIVQIGAGGHLTLQLSHFANVGAGAEIGVTANVGLIDSNFPSGTAASPAAAFGVDSAVVEVSRLGRTWTMLGGGPVELNMPAMFFTNAGPFDAAPPAAPQPSDFGRPFTPAGGLSAFDGLAYPQIVTLLDGSGGGTWLDLSGTGLSEVGLVRFSVPAGGEPVEIDAVSIATAAVGRPIPEPSSLTMAFVASCLAILCVWIRRYRMVGRPALAACFALLCLPAAPLTAGTILSETFSTDPIAAGRADVIGDAGRLTFAPGSMTADYDTALATTAARWPLGRTLDEDDDFSFVVDFTINSQGFSARGDLFAQIGFGLVNSATTGTDRAGGGGDAGNTADDAVLVDYFPGVSPVFRSPTISPAIIETNDGSSFFNRIHFAQGAESGLDDPGDVDLPRDVPLRATVTYEAAANHAAAFNTLSLLVRGPGGPLAINSQGELGAPGGLDGDPHTIQLLTGPDAPFAVDRFALTLWEDTFGEPGVSTVRADVVFSGVRVFDDATAVPEPGGWPLAAWGIAGLAAAGLARRRRRRQARLFISPGVYAWESSAASSPFFAAPSGAIGRVCLD